MVLSFPKVIEIQTQSQCNAKCTICPHSNIYPKGFKHQQLDWPILQKLIDEIADNKEKVDRIIPYWNNEPFLDKRFIQILRYIKTKEIQCEVSTNASALTESIADILTKEDLVNDLRISFFSSDRVIYNKIMPGLNFDKCIKNIQKLLELQKSNTPKNMKITINQVAYDGFDRLKEEKECINIFGNNFNYHVFGYLDRVGSNRVKNNLKIQNLTEEEKLGITLAGCSLNRAESWFSICSTGEVVLCSQDWAKEEILGNVHNCSIQEIFLGGKREKVLEKLHSDLSELSNFICTRCKLSDIIYDGERYSNEIILK